MGEGGKPTMTWKSDRTATWKGAVIHHTDGVNDYSQKEVPAIINGIYIFRCKTRGWGDIGYNLPVDKYGGIWEGRDDGVANTVARASSYRCAYEKLQLRHLRSGNAGGFPRLHRTHRGSDERGRRGQRLGVSGSGNN